MLTFEGVTANAERANLASSEVDQGAITPDYFKTMRTPLRYEKQLSISVG
jgi:hypothetical protein